MFDKFKNVKLLAMDFDGVIGKKSKWWGPNGIELKECDGRDGYGLNMIMYTILGIPMMVISNEDSPISRKYCEGHHIEFLHAGHGIGKDTILTKYCSEHNIDLSNVCYIGDDITDLCCLDVVGIPVAVDDCHSSLISPGMYRTSNPGGGGAVREVIDMIYEAHDCICDVCNCITDIREVD